MTRVSFRPACEDDMAWVASVLSRDVRSSLCLEGFDRSLEECEIIASKALDMLRSQGVDGSIIIANLDGGPAGMVWVARMTDANSGEERAFVLDIHVEEGCRGRGIGKGLMREAEEWGRRRGLVAIALAVSEGNIAARGLYEGLGFCTQRRIMRKDL